MLTSYTKLRSVYFKVGFKLFLKKIFKYIYKKILKFISLLVLSPFLVILLIIVRLFSIFKQIRFLPLNYDRIGNIYSLYWYQKLKNFDHKKNPGKFLDFFFIEKQNTRLSFWKNITTRNLKVLPFGYLWKIFFRFNDFLGNSDKYKIKNLSYLSTYYSTEKNFKDFNNFTHNFDLENFSKKKINLLNFNNKEINNGREFLKTKGTKEFSYVCFASRDSAYLKHRDSKFNWDYHNWRNCEIDNYNSAINFLSNKNIVCFRTGYKVEKKISFSNDKIIDYADSIDQSRLLDIYLPSKCMFSINAQSGLTLPLEFSCRPIVYVNWPDMHLNAWHNDSLVIFKKYYSNKKKRHLKFKEILDLDYEILGKDFKKIQKELDLSLEENDPEEIRDVVEEQFKRIKNEWEESLEEKTLQNKFWTIYEKKFIRSPSFRIGSNFLKKYSHLI